MSAPEYESSTPRSWDGTSAPEQQMFEAAERLLEKTAARDVSVEQILKEAKVSRGTFYHYFSSKWDVINKLAQRVMGDIYTRIDLYVAPDDDTPHREVLERSIN